MEGIESISAKLSMNHESLRQWVRRAEAGAPTGLTTERAASSTSSRRTRSCGQDTFLRTTTAMSSLSVRSPTRASNRTSMYWPAERSVDW